MPVLMIISIGSSLCRQDSVATSMETVQKAQLWQPCAGDAISFNSIPGMVHTVPGGRENMLIHVKLGVPPEFPEVDVEEVARVFPCASCFRLR